MRLRGEWVSHGSGDGETRVHAAVAILPSKRERSACENELENALVHRDEDDGLAESGGALDEVGRVVHRRAANLKRTAVHLKRQTQGEESVSRIETTSG